MAKFDWRYITIGILRLVQSYDVILLKYYSQNKLHGISIYGKRKLRIQSKDIHIFCRMNGNNKWQ